MYVLVPGIAFTGIPGTESWFERQMVGYGKSLQGGDKLLLKSWKRVTE